MTVQYEAQDETQFEATRQPTTIRSSDRTDGTDVDWHAMIRLGVVASIAAAIAAVALAGVLPEPVIVVGIIVLATMASWYQIEVASAPAAPVTHARRHR